MNDSPRVAFVALGSNLDGPERQVARAFDELARLPATTLTARSRLYRSAPLGGASQPDYVNAVARIETALGPHELLDALLAIERAHGRERRLERWGPRTLDLDLVLYGDAVIDEPGLKVPHPGLTERAFVLYPLAELAPELGIPGADTLQAALARVSAGGLTVIEERHPDAS